MGELAPLSFFDPQTFEAVQNAVMTIGNSSLLPEPFRFYTEAGWNERRLPPGKSRGNLKTHNNEAKANLMIAMNLAQRLRLDLMTITQELHIINSRPSFSSKFLIAKFNTLPEFSTLRYEMKKESETDFTTWACRAWAFSKDANEKVYGPWVSYQMAIIEGWATKKGSKWPALPELMLNYRCAAFFVRLYAPEISLGITTDEEIADMAPVEKEVKMAVVVDNAGLPKESAPLITSKSVKKRGRPPKKDVAETPEAEVVELMPEETTEIETPLTEDDSNAAEMPIEGLGNISLTQFTKQCQNKSRPGEQL